MSGWAWWARRGVAACGVVWCGLAACFQPALEEDVEGGDTTVAGDLGDAADGTDEADGVDTADGADAAEVAPECGGDADCEDDNPCTVGERCDAGRCVGGEPKVCAPISPCHGAGICDPSTGVCSTPARAEGAECDDGDACTHEDRCTDGVCVGAPGSGAIAGYGRAVLSGEGHTSLAALVATDEAETYALVHTEAESLTLQALRSLVLTAPAGATETLWLIEVSEVADPSKGHGVAFAWSDTPAPEPWLRPHGELAVASDRNLIAAFGFERPYLMRGDRVGGAAEPGVPYEGGVAVLRVKRGGDVEGGVEVLGSARDFSPAWAASADGMVLAWSASTEASVIVRPVGGAAEVIAAREGAGIRAIVERRDGLDELVYRRSLEASGEEGVVVVTGARVHDGHAWLVGAAHGAVTLRDEGGQSLGEIGTGLGAFDAFIIELDGEGGLVSWRTFFGGPDARAVAFRPFLHDGVGGLVVNADGPTSTRAGLASGASPIGPQSAPATRFRGLVVSLGEEPVVITTLLGDGDLRPSAAVARDGVLAVAGRGSPGFVEGGELLPAGGHVLALEGHGRSVAGVVGRVVGWDVVPDPREPYDPYTDLPPVDALPGDPRLAVLPGGAVIVGGDFARELVVGVDSLATVTLPGEYRGVYFALVNEGLGLLCGE